MKTALQESIDSCNELSAKYVSVDYEINQIITKNI